MNMTDMQDMPEMITTANEIEARARLLSRKKKRKEILVSVPEWGMDVLLTALTATERGEYFAFNNDIGKTCQQGSSDFFKRLWFEQVRLGCRHPVTRERILQPADRDEFMDGEDGAVIETLADIIRDISGLNAGNIEEAKKKLLSAKNTDTANLQNGSTAKVEMNS
jgi:hypothetical protein